MMSGKISSEAAGSASRSTLKMEHFKSDQGDGPSLIMKAFWENRNMRKEVSYEGSRDVVLILDDGVVEAHAAILCGSSQFFRDIFETQGVVIDPIRKIIMPGFSVRIVEGVIKLMYSEEVHAKSPKQAKEIRSALKYLGINQDSMLSIIPKSDVIDPCDDNFVSELFELLGLSDETDTLVLPGGDLASKKNKNKKALQTLPSLPAKSSTSACQERVAGTDPNQCDAESDNSDFDYGEMKKKAEMDNRRRTAAVQLVKLKIFPDDEDDKSVEYMNASTDDDAERNKNPQWLMTESKICQKCKRNYESYISAGKCVVSHDWIRCYLCLKIFKNTELLYSHYQQLHGAPGKEKFVKCPFCDQCIPFHNASYHVDRVHLSISLGDSSWFPKTAETVRRALPDPNDPPSKRPKLAN